MTSDPTVTVGEDTSTVSYLTEAVTTGLPVTTDPIAPDPVFAIILGLWNLVGLLFNLIIAITFILSSKLKTPANVFVINLAIADCAIFMTSIPAVVSVYTGWGRDMFSDFTCHLYPVCAALASFSSVCFIGAIGFTRYIYICGPQKQVTWLVWKKCLIGACFIWCLNIGLAFFGLSDYVAVQYHEKLFMCAFDFGENPVFIVVLLGATYISSAVVMTFSYIQILVKVRKHVKMVHPMSQSSIAKTELRLAVQIFIIYVVYNLCWGTVSSLTVLDPQFDLPIFIYKLFIFLIFISSFINFPIYLYFNRTFREEVCRLWLCWS